MLRDYFKLRGGAWAVSVAALVQAGTLALQSKGLLLRRRERTC
jgi:hypothetical protein